MYVVIECIMKMRMKMKMKMKKRKSILHIYRLQAGIC